MKPAHTILVTLCSLAMAGSVVAVGWGLSQKQNAVAQNAATSRTICSKVDRLDSALIQIVRSSGRKPPKPGDYGYDYYVHHPREAQALRGGHVNAGTLAILRKAACDPANIH